MGGVDGPRDVVEGAPPARVDVGQGLPRAAPVALGAGEGVAGVDGAVVPLGAVQAQCTERLVGVLARHAGGGGR